jgi:hypothetical protein
MTINRPGVHPQPFETMFRQLDVDNVGRRSAFGQPGQVTIEANWT